MLESVAGWTCQFTPRVSLEPPHALLAEVAGSLRCFGGLEMLLESLRDGLKELGFEASIAVAATPRAALWKSRGEGLEAAGFDDEILGFLRSIGIRTMKELEALPRDGLAKRCGQGLLDQLDQALGRLPEPREFFVPPPRFSAALELPGAVSHAEGVLFAARRLLLQLEGLLAARHAGIREFSLDLLHPKKSMSIMVRLASPSRETARFERLLRERLATVSLAEPVEAIRLEAENFAPLPGRNAAMFGDAPAEAEGWAQLLERLRMRLGHAAVHGLTAQPDHRPEHAWRRVEPGDWDPREFVQPGARPTWLLEAPRRLAQADFELLAGPERIECGWWDGDEAKRDYFIAGLPGASLAWIYREGGEWFLHGYFA
jgi:protein ImuB